ncbi:MAG: type I-E CRISPR-associated protein Cse1/CasA [Chloroflexi bacterium]|nr:type I-E CRISPR-associated protein Cse1/CasA [Chloroflexota bacterium]
MSPHFNLLDEPWIPCMLVDRQQPVDLSLCAVLVRAPEVREIVDASPLITAALHRLLLAIIRRNFEPEGVDAWADLWEAARWDQARLQTYFDRWRDRFDLFNERHPFYQVAGLEEEYGKPISQLTHELASSANAVLLFDHTTDPVLTPAQAARYVIAFHSFDVSGTKSLGKTEPIAHKYARAGPLTKTAVVLVKGPNLFQTLMLNLHGFPRPDTAALQGEDLPAWERPSPTEPIDRYPAGCVDLLTWQSRRIRLLPEPGPDGRIVIRRAVIMKGYQLPDPSVRKELETMLAFHSRPGAKANEDPWPPVSLREDRALWRDSLALFQAGGAHARPRTLDWLSRLVRNGILTRAAVLPLDVYGVTTDPKNQANVIFWRHERLPLPLAYLEESARSERLLDTVTALIHLAEAVGSLFELGFDAIPAEGKALVIPRPVQVLAALLVAPTEQRQPRKDDLRPIVRHLAPGQHYWPRLEVPFKQLLVDMASDPAVDDDRVWNFGAEPKARWAKTLRREAWNAFEAIVQGLDESPRTIKAVARAQHELAMRLGAVLKGYGTDTQQVAEEAARDTATSNHVEEEQG